MSDAEIASCFRPSRLFLRLSRRDCHSHLIALTDGDAFRTLLAMLSDVLPTSPHGPADLQLHLHLSSTSGSGVNRFIGEARVPLAPLLQQSASPIPIRAAPTALVAADGHVAADVLVTAAAPQLLQAVKEATQRAHTLELTVHDLSIDPRLLAQSGAWGVWVQTHLFAAATANSTATASSGSAAMAAVSDKADAAGIIRTAANPFDRSGRVEFGHSLRVPVPLHSAVERRLLETLSSASSGEVALDFEVYCSGPMGPTLLATGTLPIPVPPPAHAHAAALEDDGADEAAADLYLRRVPLHGINSGGDEIGEIRVTLLCSEVLRAAASRLHHSPELQVASPKSNLVTSALCIAHSSQLALTLLNASHSRPGRLG